MQIYLAKAFDANNQMWSLSIYMIFVSVGVSFGTWTPSFLLSHNATAFLATATRERAYRPLYASLLFRPATDSRGAVDSP